MKSKIKKNVRGGLSKSFILNYCPMSWSCQQDNKLKLVCILGVESLLPFSAWFFPGVDAFTVDISELL